jgi:hypothetical protein
MSSSILLALLITVVIEVPIVALVYRGVDHSSALRMALVCLVTTSATNFAMNAGLPRLIHDYRTFILLGELCALVLEATVYTLTSRPRDLARACVASGLANAASFAAGFLL